MLDWVLGDGLFLQSAGVKQSYHRIYW